MTQSEALDILKTGAHVFLTGAAGSGKTHVLREYIACLRDRRLPIGITASTGIAATHMGGMTVHSWSGIGVKEDLTEWDIDDIASRESLAKRMMAARVLIIDEISMLHHYRLDMVDSVLRHVRDSSRPFGGLQVVLCGDFFQLPPVTRSRAVRDLDSDLFGNNDHGQSKFAYYSKAWRDADLKVCYLEEQYRQNDARYLSVLDAIRKASVNQDTMDLLRTRLNSELSGTDITKLYSHNVDVDGENERSLSLVDGRIHEYKMSSSGNKRLLESLKRNCLAPETLRLKRGARVMFVKNNYDKNYANGTCGIVSECSYESITVATGGRNIRVERESWRLDDNGKVLAEIDQFPLRLAWAITIHKSQGMSLDEAVIDLSQSFEKGMGYVALSRVRSLSGLSLLGLNTRALEVHPEALEYDQYFKERSEQCAAEIAVMAKTELRTRHDAFLGPEQGVAEPPTIKKNRRAASPVRGLSRLSKRSI